MPANTRMPAVAGSFYPDSRDSLKVTLDNLMELPISKSKGTGELLGLIVPHAGFVYSGKTAALAYSRLKGTKSRRFVIVGPNHSSYPFYSAVYPYGQWSTPLGNVSVDEKLCTEITRSAENARLDAAPHAHEHSVEVQLPFLQYMLGNDITIAPIIMGKQGLETASEIASALVKVKDEFTLIASSDLNHYEPLDTTNRKDDLLIEAILELDVDKFYSVLEKEQVSACGYGPIAILMEYTRQKRGKLEPLGHTTSYDASGDSRNVVGYCSIMSSRQH